MQHCAWMTPPSTSTPPPTGPPTWGHVKGSTTTSRRRDRAVGEVVDRVPGKARDDDRRSYLPSTRPLMRWARPRVFLVGLLPSGVSAPFTSARGCLLAPGPVETANAAQWCVWIVSGGAFASACRVQARQQLSESLRRPSRPSPMATPLRNRRHLRRRWSRHPPSWMSVAQGSSLQAEYERRAVAREGRAWARHPRIGGFLLAVTKEAGVNNGLLDGRGR